MDSTKVAKRPTIGQLINEMNAKPFDVGDAWGPEITNPLLADYERQFTQMVAVGKERYPQKDFFMEVRVLLPKILNRQVLRFVMHPRRTLPVPTFDQCLYRYHHASDDLTLVWVIPSIENCAALYERKDSIPDDLKENLKYVLHFKEGTLFSDMYKKYHQTQ